ncbi:uncharacterized protein IL334_003351 [Kwoniella shivajii]|uniref:Uncharacterized protein n=1 Tax=Kwoniella shivajii TaxID=564305 RepID=A0ABZ1CYZ4_9TREE|nr:hypothetical protein IL334_003351 [Kwoniella shivajii]
MSLRSISRFSTSPLAGSGSGPGPSRSKYIRRYATGSQPGPQQNQTIGEMLNRRAFASAWRALSPNQKLIFGGLVGIGAYFEYSLMDRYILGPAKSRKEEQKRTELEKSLGAAGGGKRETLLGEVTTVFIIDIFVVFRMTQP